MKVEAIASTIGGGTLALTASSVILSIAVAQLLTRIEWMPPEVAYLIVGAALAGVGYILLTRGVEEASEKVEDTVETVEETVEHVFDVEHQVRRHPWVAVGGSVVVGLLLAKLVPLPLPFLPRRRRAVVYEASSGPRPVTTPSRSSSPVRSDESSSSLLGGIAGSLGRLATQQAISLGMGFLQTAMTTMFVKQAAEEGAHRAADPPPRPRPRPNHVA